MGEYDAGYENCIGSMVRQMEDMQFRIDSLHRENAKLRELLQDLAICACGKYCYGCPHQYDGCDRDQRLRELGVEVDE